MVILGKTISVTRCRIRHGEWDLFCTRENGVGTGNYHCVRAVLGDKTRWSVYKGYLPLPCNLVGSVDSLSEAKKALWSNEF